MTSTIKYTINKMWTIPSNKMTAPDFLSRISLIAPLWLKVPEKSRHIFISFINTWCREWFLNFNILFSMKHSCQIYLTESRQSSHHSSHSTLKYHQHKVNTYRTLYHHMGIHTWAGMTAYEGITLNSSWPS